MILRHSISYRDDDGGTNRGAVWILFLNPNGTVKSHQKISHTQGGGPRLDNNDVFGIAGSLGDLDGDGVRDLAVGAIWDDDGGTDRGAVWILFLDGVCPEDINSDGTINVLDLIDLLLCFGQPAVPGCESEDINEDGTVNVLDLIELLLAFGTSCP